MTTDVQPDGHTLVADVRRAAAAHNLCWERLVPDQFTVRPDAEAAEEHAYGAMAVEKQRLRDHIHATYGIPIGELASLAMP